MSLTSASIKLAKRIARNVEIPTADIPTFLCPGLLSLRSSPNLSSPSRPRALQRFSGRRQFSITRSRQSVDVQSSPKLSLDKLPQQCPGCGAFSQLVDVKDAGFYTTTRKVVKEYLGDTTSQNESPEDVIFKQALENAGKFVAGLSLQGHSKSPQATEPPICDRCHELKHHSTGVPIHHPSITSIQETIYESPHKYNHIYHVVDAADFPMSLVPGLERLLNLTPQRSLNRRSKTGRFYLGKKTEVSFIITRSDLLAPLKEQVDSMMPYLRDVLRDALGRSAKDVRLGNVRCVSAKRQWWTKELKEEIWKRGGGGWMVGKVNVGKSQLFHDVFPKGRRDQKSRLLPTKKVTDLDRPNDSEVYWNSVSLGSGADAMKLDGQEGKDTLELAQNESNTEPALSASEPADIELRSVETSVADVEEETDHDGETNADEYIDTSYLLPPSQPETDYPAMPLVSSLPGTTASPIRLSFGSGKGELIDLPGLSRGDLELHVKPEHRQSLVMNARVRPEQQSIKPGQSLLLGGFIRITPLTPDIVFLAYAFMPLKAHRTATHKAVEIIAQTYEGNVENIALPGAAAVTKSAGVFPLKWDVTRKRAGPITNPSAIGIKPDRLPYQVMSTDILIEGCGWVELVAQIRKSRSYAPIPLLNTSRPVTDSLNNSEDSNTENGTKIWRVFPEPEKEQELEIQDPDWPMVEVFSPEGKFVAQRRPMNAWLHFEKGPKKSTPVQPRQRRAMKGVKKVEKTRRRMAQAPKSE